MLKWWEENGGWYRDRTCDPYHVKVIAFIKNRIKSMMNGDFVPRSFVIGSGQSRAIPGITRAEERPNPVETWMAECSRHHGRVLTDHARHYCPDWSGLPIDTSVAEFAGCGCRFLPPTTGEWLHLKSGKSYSVIEHRLAILEATMTEVVIYTRTDGSGPLWIRPAEEFFDGRFLHMATDLDYV